MCKKIVPTVMELQMAEDGKIGRIIDFQLSNKFPESYYPFAQHSNELSGVFVEFTHLIKEVLDQMYGNKRLKDLYGEVSIDPNLPKSQRVKQLFEITVIDEHHSYGDIAHGLIMFTILDFLLVGLNNKQRIASFGSGSSMYEIFLSQIMSGYKIDHKITCLDICESIVEQVTILIDQLLRIDSQGENILNIDFSADLL